jgi:hypothetical protein
LNPVRAGIVGEADKYEWSSLPYYVGVRNPPEWLQRDFILGYFGMNYRKAENEYKKFVMNLQGQEYESPLKEVFASTILGDTGFIEYVRNNFLKNKEVDSEMPASKSIIDRTSMTDIFSCVDQEFRDDRLSKDIKQYLCHRYTNERLKTIGAQFGVSESAVSHAVRRAKTFFKKDKKMQKRVDRLINKLELSRFKT